METIEINVYIECANCGDSLETDMYERRNDQTIKVAPCAACSENIREEIRKGAD